MISESKVKKVWYKRWWAIVLFIFMGLIILGNLLGNDSSNNNIKAQTPKPSSDNNANQVEVKTYSISDSINAGDFIWKVTGVSTTNEIGQDIAGTFLGEKADGYFVILAVEVENKANTAKYLTDSYIKLVDYQGREFSPNSVAAIYLKPQGSALVFEQINPGITKKGKIVYDIPKNVKQFDVKITSSLFSSNVYSIKIKIEE